MVSDINRRVDSRSYFLIFITLGAILVPSMRTRKMSAFTSAREMADETIWREAMMLPSVEYILRSEPMALSPTRRVAVERS